MKQLAQNWLLITVLLLGPALSSLPARADDVKNLSNQAVVPGETAAQCYADASLHLNHGEWFVRAIAQLNEAIRQDPKNPDYHLALGCAEADRVSSLGYAEAYALYYKSDVAQYEKNWPIGIMLRRTPRPTILESRSPWSRRCSRPIQRTICAPSP